MRQSRPRWTGKTPVHATTARLDDAELGIAEGLTGSPKYRRPRDAWRDLSEQLRPFPTQTVFE